MNTSVTAFIFEGSAVRTVMREGEPWFVLADVCRVLGSENPSKAATVLDDDEKGQEVFQTPGGPQRMTVVSESGLYTISLRSNGATTPGTVQHRFPPMGHFRSPPGNPQDRRLPTRQPRRTP